MGAKDFQHKQTENKSATPPMDYNNMYLKGTNGEVPSDLFDETEKKIADNFCRVPRKEGVSITSLRRIFDEAKRFQQILTDDNFAEHLPYIKMIKSKTAYTVARQIKQKSILATQYNSLNKFISWGLSQVVDKKTYDIFISLFEAVYGYYYDLAPSK